MNQATAPKHEAKVLLIGLPDAGKTTFTAAFWGVVNSTQIPGALRLVAYSGDDTYLNKIYGEWSRGLKVPRTSRNDEGLGIVQLSDSGKSSRQYGDVIIPDLAGDRFATQWESRVISKEHESHLKSVDGILFFIHPTRINDGVINSPQMQTLDSLFEGKDNEKEVLSIPAQPFTAKKVPTQTILTDILQTTLDVGTSIRKIAVIVSAWDLVKVETSPEPWLAKKLPLLSQYLRAHADQFEVKMWGVSAEGGDLRNVDDEERKRILTKSLTRIVVTDGKKVDSDITRPLRWLFADREKNGR